MIKYAPAPDDEQITEDTYENLSDNKGDPDDDR